MSILIVLLGCLIISFIVFGGAQMFIPYFKILLINFLKISQEEWDAVLSIANSTPGVFGLKIAFASGFLAARNEWWGYLLMFGTYLIFILIPILIMMVIMKKYNKFKKSKFMNTFLKIMRPIIAGILLSIAINLALSIITPFLVFNDLGDNLSDFSNYFKFKEDSFFKGWRYWVLLSWSLVSIPIDLFMIRKYKINILYLIVINIILCFILFEPWLN